MIAAYVVTMTALLACSSIGCWPAVVVLGVIAVGLVFTPEARALRRKHKARCRRTDAVSA
jgi:uncharacterized membrane protein